jgi:hypothetical protein
MRPPRLEGSEMVGLIYGQFRDKIRLFRMFLVNFPFKSDIIPSNYTLILLL